MMAVPIWQEAIARLKRLLLGQALRDSWGNRAHAARALVRARRRAVLV